MLKRKLLFTVLAGMLVCGQAAATRVAFHWVEARNTIQAPVTGPTPPPLHAEEYEPYRRPGAATITGIMHVTLADGTQVPCRFGTGGHEAFLFPDTSYTRWALERWTTLLDHRYISANTGGDAFPGENDPRIPMPSYLDLGNGSLIGDVGCEEDGRFTFHNVPNGKYIVVGSVGLDHLQGSGDSSTETAVTTPVGPVEVMSEGHASLRSVLGQQWKVVSIGSIEVLRPTTYVVKSSNLVPAATYFVQN